MKLTRENAILPFLPYTDFRGKEGYAVKPNGSKVELIDENDETPIGVIVHGTNTGEKSSIAIASGGLAGTVKVKLGAAVTTVGQDLEINSGGNFIPASGAGSIVCAQALETGVTGELVEAVLFKPITLT